MRRSIPYATTSAIGASLFCALMTVGVAAKEEASEDGKLAFNNACRTCHSFKPNDNRLGPTLHGIVGRQSGSLEGFQFSSAMKSAGITWDESSLDKFIANPDQVVHGNAMKPFGGIADASERQKIVAYLKTLK
ncbi:MAG TPA: c-type cytochrome [Hyphomicrobium sp.]|nr:c-type cytochrome [Hyphomicrobium sp.]